MKCIKGVSSSLEGEDDGDENVDGGKRVRIDGSVTFDAGMREAIALLVVVLGNVDKDTENGGVNNTILSAVEKD